MKYMLLIYESEAEWKALSEDEQRAEFNEYVRFTEDIRQSGNYSRRSRKFTKAMSKKSDRSANSGGFPTFPACAPRTSLFSRRLKMSA